MVWFVARVLLVITAVGVAIAWHRYGYAPVAVQTGSMSPTYPVHTLLFVHDTPAIDVRVGDVITFDPPGRVPRTTHRVVSRTLHAGRWYFETKGDANPVADDWRQAGTPASLANEPYLRGISYPNGTAVRTEGHLPHAGWFAELGGMPKVRHVLIAFPFAIIALQLLQWIWSSGGSETKGPRRRDGEPGSDTTQHPSDSEHAAA